MGRMLHLDKLGQALAHRNILPISTSSGLATLKLFEMPAFPDVAVTTSRLGIVSGNVASTVCCSHICIVPLSPIKTNSHRIVSLWMGLNSLTCWAYGGCYRSISSCARG